MGGVDNRHALCNQGCGGADGIDDIRARSRADCFPVQFQPLRAQLVGAGDSKLVTVVALFVGLERLPQFAFATAIVGGALAVVSLAANPRRALVMFQMRGRGDFERNVPYGVAIAVAGIFTVFLAVKS